MSNDYRQYHNKRRRLKRRRRIRRLPKRICALAFMLCICLGLIRTARDLSALHGRRDAVSMESLLAFKKHNQEMITYFGEETDSHIMQDLQELAEKNEEAWDFVEDYPNRANYLGMDPDLSYELDREINANEVPLLMQWDKRWGYEEYGDSIMGLSGCGPTCLSMVYLHFTQDPKGHPGEMGIFCEEKGYYTEAGTSWQLWTDGVAQLGLSGRELALDEKVMRKALNDGSLIVCSMRPGDFTTTGHYILIHGWNEQGFLINDPNRKSNSEKIWSYDTLKGQIKNLWEISL